jgi:hypothetical protein
MDAHAQLSEMFGGKLVLVLRGEEIYRITGRKDQYGELKRIYLQ